MTKKIVSLVLATLFVATYSDVRAGVALNAAQSTQVVQVIAKAQTLLADAQKAGLTQDEATALLANAVQNNPHFDAGALTPTQQKVLLAVVAVMLGTYLVISIYQKTPLFWNWKWSENEEEISVLERHFKEKKAILNEAMENVIKKASGNKRIEATIRAFAAGIQTGLDRVAAKELEMAKLSREEKLKGIEADFNRIAQRVSSACL